LASGAGLESLGPSATAEGAHLYAPISAGDCVEAQLATINSK